MLASQQAAARLVAGMLAKAVPFSASAGQSGTPPCHQLPTALQVCAVIAAHQAAVVAGLPACRPADHLRHSPN